MMIDNTFKESEERYLICVDWLAPGYSYLIDSTAGPYPHNLKHSFFVLDKNKSVREEIIVFDYGSNKKYWMTDKNGYDTFNKYRKEYLKL